MPNVWEELFQQGKIRRTTCSLLDSLAWGAELSIPIIADFGISSDDHRAALKYAILFDDDAIAGSPDEDVFEQQVRDEMRKRICELDRALMHGQRLTTFVQKYAPGRHSEVIFHTGKDALAEMLEQSRNE